MILRFLFLLATVSLLIPIGSAIAFNQSESALNHATFIAQLPPLPLPPDKVQSGVMSEPPWTKDLNLSTEQQERIKTNHEQVKKDIEGLLEQLKDADNQMRSLLESNASSEQLRQQHQEIQKLYQQIDDKYFETILADYQVLTSDQRAQLTKLMQQHQKQSMKNGEESHFL